MFGDGGNRLNEELHQERGDSYSFFALPHDSKWLPNVGEPNVCESKILLAHLNREAKQGSIDVSQPAVVLVRQPL